MLKRAAGGKEPLATGSANRVRKTAGTRVDQIIRLAAEGCTDKEIALKLGIAENTVDSHWARIRKLYDVPSRAAAVHAYLKAKMDRSLSELRETQELLEKAFNERGEKLGIVVLEMERRSRDGQRLAAALGLFDRATAAVNGFAYEVEATQPFRCLHISRNAESYGIDRRAILLNEINFWDCVFPADVAQLYELTMNSPFRKGIRYVHVYRLKTPAPRWVVDAHQCIYDEEGRLRVFHRICHGCPSIDRYQAPHPRSSTPGG